LINFNYSSYKQQQQQQQQQLFQLGHWHGIGTAPNPKFNQQGAAPI